MNEQRKETEVTLKKQSQTPGSATTELASRWSRLFASLIDLIVGVVIAIPFWFLTGAWEKILSGQPYSMTEMLLGSAYGFIGFVCVHYYFLNKNGQTIGKLLLGIKICGWDGSIASANSIVFKRYLPMSAVAIIPFVGGVIAVIDVLLIFGKEKRCLHDLIAGTKVIKA